MKRDHGLLLGILMLIAFVGSDWYQAAIAIQTVVLLALMVSGMVVLSHFHVTRDQSR